MAYDNFNASNEATLSQSELFQRYLDAPLRASVTHSALITQVGSVVWPTAREALLCGAYPEALPDDLSEQILDVVAADEDPSDALQRCLYDLENQLDNLRALKRDFDLLVELTRTEAPEEGAPEAYDDWEMNPRYVLPMIEQKDAA